MLLTLLSLLLAGPAPVSVFVGPMVRDGFVDTDRGVRDSIADLKRVLGSKKEFQVVDTEGAATLRLYVTGRNTRQGGTETAGIAAAGYGVVTGEPKKIKRLETRLVVGTHEREFSAEDDNWLGLAGRIAKDLAVWVAANRTRLAEG